jgi:hypothetical protein
MPETLQIPSIILPLVLITGAEREMVADLVEHTSLEFPVEWLQEKEIHIVAIEVATVAAAVPGNLECWVELSPYPSANSSYWPTPLPTSIAYWAAIGGGGGISLPPVAPLIEISSLAGAAGMLTHTILLPWAIHSPWARLVVQTPVAAALPAAYWEVQAMISAKR